MSRKRKRKELRRARRKKLGRQKQHPKEATGVGYLPLPETEEEQCEIVQGATKQEEDITAVGET